MTDHKQQIQDAEQKVEAAYQAAADARARVLTVAAAAFREWAPETARARVTKNHDRAITAGKERIQTLRRDVEDLVARADEIVQAELGAPPDVWPHLNLRDHAGEGRVFESYQGRDLINRPMSLLAGYVGELLLGAELEPTTGAGLYWRRDNTTFTTARSRVTPAHRVDLYDSIGKAYGDYLDEVGDLQQAIIARNRAIRLAGEAEASNLWD